MRGNTRGWTLVEALVVIGIVAVLTALAVPSFARMMQRQRVQGAAQTLKADLAWLRTESLRRREPLFLTTTSGAAGSCYVLHTVSGGCTCGANGSAQCGGGEALKVVAFPAGQPVQLLSAPAEGLQVHPRIGLSKVGRVTVGSADTQMQLIVSQFRARTCTVGIDC